MDETPPPDECKLPDKLCEVSMEKALDLLHQDVESKLKIEYRRKAKRVWFQNMYTQNIQKHNYVHKWCIDETKSKNARCGIESARKW